MLIARFRYAVAVWTLLAAVSVALGQPAPTPPSLPGAGGKSAPISGKVARLGDISVLDLWGGPEQAGYAHGYLLAVQIAALFDDYILDPRNIPEPAFYEGFLLQIRRNFAWPDAVLAELTAMERGARDRLGEKFRSKRLNRELTLDDLLLANAMADLHQIGCSSFTVWGPLTADGQPITGRNLDFPYTTLMMKSQIVMVYHGATPDSGWVGVTWPGLIGVYTAMNSRGVTIALHDAPGLPLTDAIGSTPRSITLRMALEKAESTTFVTDIQSVLSSNRVRVGNNIHASAPFERGRPCAAVYEYDGNPRDKGVQLRLPKDDELLGAALCCTNHMRLRESPTACRRYDRVGTFISTLKDKSQKLDIETAFQLLKDVRQSHTLHSVVFEPAAGRMHVLIPALQATPETIKLSQWLTPRP